MAIQPIDLQTLFTQVDKVGKAQSALREGLAEQQAIQGVQLQRKTEARIQEVNETQNAGDGVEKVKDQGRKNASGQGKKEKGSGGDAEDENAEQQPEIFKDPYLGKNIDISL